MYLSSKAFKIMMSEHRLQYEHRRRQLSLRKKENRCGTVQQTMPEGVLTSSEGDQKINVATTFGVLYCWVYTWPTLKRFETNVDCCSRTVGFLQLGLHVAYSKKI
jgi:hypothetical protein